VRLLATSGRGCGCGLQGCCGLGNARLGRNRVGANCANIHERPPCRVTSHRPLSANLDRFRSRKRRRRRSAGPHTHRLVPDQSRPRPRGRPGPTRQANTKRSPWPGAGRHRGQDEAGTTGQRRRAHPRQEWGADNDPEAWPVRARINAPMCTICARVPRGVRRAESQGVVSLSRSKQAPETASLHVPIEPLHESQAATARSLDRP